MGYDGVIAILGYLIQAINAQGVGMTKALYVHLTILQKYLLDSFVSDLYFTGPKSTELRRNLPYIIVIAFC